MEITERINRLRVELRALEAERAKMLTKLVAEGTPIRELAQQMGLTTQRVYQIVSQPERPIKE